MWSAVWRLKPMRNWAGWRVTKTAWTPWLSKVGRIWGDTLQHFKEPECKVEALRRKGKNVNSELGQGFMPSFLDKSHKFVTRVTLWTYLFTPRTLCCLLLIAELQFVTTKLTIVMCRQLEEGFLTSHTSMPLWKLLNFQLNQFNSPAKTSDLLTTLKA